MVNYRTKLNIDFDLSEAQIKVLEQNEDTIVRAVPGSGKTTILTLKIKNLLQDNFSINQVCCISYSNVNVDDLEKSCTKRITKDLIDKINFLTFHKFCLDYILIPFSYLYRSKMGLRAYKEIFNYKEHGETLIKYLSERKISAKDIKIIAKTEKIFYNFKFNNSKNNWEPISNSFEQATLISYLNFLNANKLIDFNLISLLSLFILQENEFIRSALNKSIDWIFIDEFQDVSEIQCKIIESIRKSRTTNSNELKWFLVGDPNQSIYGFAGANPRSMYDMREIFNSLNNCNCEIKLYKTHRCSENVFNYARKNYNRVLEIIKNSDAVKSIQSPSIIDYINDLFISEHIECGHDNGKVIFKNTLGSVAEILNLKFSELIDDEVCCVGVTRYNSIEVYRQYKLQLFIDEGEDFGIYSDLYRDYEDKYGFKYFSLFIGYLMLKNDFYNNRIKFHSSTNKYLYLLKQFISDKIAEEKITPEKLSNILAVSTSLMNNLNVNHSVSFEFFKFSENLVSALNEYFPDYSNAFMVINSKNKITNFYNINEPTIGGFLKFALRGGKDKITFEIKHIHKIKGLEYEQVIVQKLQDLPYDSDSNKIHQWIFHNKQDIIGINDFYEYIQEINKLYVMLTRSKKNLYIVMDGGKIPELITITDDTY